MWMFNMWRSVSKGPIWSFLETEILRKIDEMVKKLKKKDFPYFCVLSHQKHPYVSRILEKSLQGSIHAQFYMAIKDAVGQFLLQLCTVIVKRRKNKSPILRRGGILVKASPGRRIWKPAQMQSVRRLRLRHL